MLPLFRVLLPDNVLVVNDPKVEDHHEIKHEDEIVIHVELMEGTEGVDG